MAASPKQIKEVNRGARTSQHDLSKHEYIHLATKLLLFPEPTLVAVDAVRIKKTVLLTPTLTGNRFLLLERTFLAAGNAETRR